MKKILIIIVLSLLSLTAFAQIPFKIHNKDIRFKWGSDSMRFDITGKGFYLRDTIYFADGTKQWSADTVGGVAGNWSMSGLKIYPTTPNAYVNTDSSYYIKGVDFIRYKPTKRSIAIGYNSLKTDTSADNIGIGYVALAQNITGYEDLAIGSYSLSLNTSGFLNVAIGSNSMFYNKSGRYNTALGAYSLIDNETGWNNIAIGYNSAYSQKMSDRLWIGQGDSNNTIIYGYHGSGTKRLRLNANTHISGDLTYTYIHGQASTDSISFTTGSTQSIYYKLNPTGADTLKSHEEVGVMFPGDSAKITVSGHYSVKCYLNISTSGANDKIRVKLYKNNAPFTLNSIGTWIINSDGTGANSETKGFEWYVTLASGDYLSVRVANLTGARACVLRDMKLIIEKKPE